jgi:hypothetical protein
MIRKQQDIQLDQIISDLEITKHNSKQINNHLEIQKPLIEKTKNSQEEVKGLIEKSNERLQRLISN